MSRMEAKNLEEFINECEAKQEQEQLDELCKIPHCENNTEKFHTCAKCKNRVCGNCWSLTMTFCIMNNHGTENILTNCPLCRDKRVIACVEDFASNGEGVDSIKWMLDTAGINRIRIPNDNCCNLDKDTLHILIRRMQNPGCTSYRDEGDKIYYLPLY